MVDESISDPEAPTQPERPLADLMQGVQGAPREKGQGRPPDPSAPVEPMVAVRSAPPPPAPRDLATSPPATSSDTKPASAHERIEGAFEWAKWAGVELSSFERAFAVFRRVGWLRGSAVLFALLFPVVKLVWLPRLVERGVTSFVEGSGVELEAAAWSTDLLGDLAVEARDLVLRAPGPYGREELLSVRRARVDLSLFGRLRRGRWVHDVSLEDGEVYLERLLSGRWNSSEIFDAPELRRQVHGFESRFAQEAASRAEGGNEQNASRGACRWYGFACLDRVRVRDVGVEWVENWPGQSGGGLVHTSRASLHVDDLEGNVYDLRLPLDPRERPSRFAFEGRVADGRFSVEGEGNFFWWSLRESEEGAIPRPSSGNAEPRTASFDGARSVDPQRPALPRATRVHWLPRGAAQLYLENVGAAAVARLVPPAAIRPVGGTVSGTIAIEFGHGSYDGRGTVELEGVQYAVNRDSPLLRGRADEIARSLDGVVVSGPVPVAFGGSAGESVAGPVAMAQASMTAAALADAAPPVVAVARADRVLLSDTLSQEGAERLESELAPLLGEQAAAELSELAASAMLERQDPEADGAATEEAAGAVRRFGRGVKRLFKRERDPG